jgi:hypothetical protein
MYIFSILVGIAVCVMVLVLAHGRLGGAGGDPGRYELQASSDRR